MRRDERSRVCRHGKRAEGGRGQRVEGGAPRSGTMLRARRVARAPQPPRHSRRQAHGRAAHKRRSAAHHEARNHASGHAGSNGDGCHPKQEHQTAIGCESNEAAYRPIGFGGVKRSAELVEIDEALIEVGARIRTRRTAQRRGATKGRPCNGARRAPSGCGCIQCLEVPRAVGPSSVRGTGCVATHVAPTRWTRETSSKGETTFQERGRQRRPR
jgi:hypothetical protein